MISDPIDGELHLLVVDLVTGVSSPHPVPDYMVDYFESEDVDQAANNIISDRSRESLPSKLE